MGAFVGRFKSQTWIGIAILINVSLAACGSDEYSKPLISSVTSMEPVELYVQNRYGEGTILKIPAAYMNWQDNREGGATANIAIKAVYPEMTPFALLSPEEQHKLKVGGSTDNPLRFYAPILLERAVFRNIERAFSKLLERRRSSPGTPEGGFMRYQVDDLLGLTDYLIPINLNRGPAGEDDTILICEPISESGGRGGTCTTYVQLSERIVLRYSIPATSIGQWRDVDEKMRRLVNSFITGCFHSPPLRGDDRPQKIYECAS